MRLRTMAIVLAVVLTGTNAWAQSETGRISGTVTDSQNALTPGVTVTAISASSGVPRSTVTDASGKYLIANLPPATYDVTFGLEGFKGVKNRVLVEVGADVAVDAKLEVGALSEQVTVVAAPESINVRTAEMRSTISGRQLMELPTLTRNPYDLVAIAGNVQEAPNEEVLLARRGPRRRLQHQRRAHGEHQHPARWRR